MSEEDEPEQSLEDLPPFFSEILEELDNHQTELGGLKHFRRRPYIQGKAKRKELAATHSDYEYIYLTVLGLAVLHLRGEEIIRKNNGQAFNHNPGVQLLERASGLTMHAERDGSENLLRTAPATLVEAFNLARLDTGHRALTWSLAFFQQAFDRTADPCLEGRVGRLMEYIEARRRAATDQGTCGLPPWEEVSLRDLPPESPPNDLVGEHLRVFMAECTWRWAKEKRLGYEDAKNVRLDEEHAVEFSRFFNASTFEAALLARGVVVEACSSRWESATKSGEWIPYDPDVSWQIEQAHRQGLAETRIRLGPKSWLYIIDLRKGAQRNIKTGQERTMRRVEGVGDVRPPCGRLLQEELSAGIEYFVEMATLPRLPEVEEKLAESTQTTSSSAPSSPVMLPAVDRTIEG